ncbi:MAG TPA: ABC transporter permease [Gaiellaceae bacterium]|nr:ABC transporter permease [Gaiellaceae bacterium]
MSTFEAPISRLAQIGNARLIAIGGLGLGLFAFWLSLPPWGVDTAGAPIGVGIAGALAGLYAAMREERKLGIWAIITSLLAVAAALWIQGRDDAAVEAVVTTGLIASMLRFATPLAFAAIGGIINERSGVVNIGLEGMMLAGAFFGIWATIWSGSWAIGLLMAMVFGGLFALIHAFFCIHLRADQIVVGTAINFLALGITGYLFRDIYGPQGTPSDISRIPTLDLGFLGSIPLVGDFLDDVFGNLSLMIWLMFALLILAWLVIFHTPIGLRLRSVGEHPRAAETVGISVYGVRYVAVVISGMLAALGGAYLSVGFTGTFNENMSAGRGFIALAAVIFGKWHPFGAFGACLLFGFASALSIPLQREADISANLLSTLPYVLTLVALVGVIGRSVGPAAVGRPYTKA